jgi:hypothetical protein
VFKNGLRTCALALFILGDVSTTQIYAQICMVPETGSFQATPPKASAFFGNTLKVDAGRTVVAAVGELAVYVFSGAGTAWQQVQRLTPSNGPTQGFGTDVDIDGNRIVVGTTAGRAYVYEETGGTWSETAILTASTFSALAGRVVSVDGDHIAITHDTFPSSTVYLFTKFGPTWFETQQLTAVQPQSMDMDNGVLALAGGNLVRIYELSGILWQQVFQHTVTGIGADVKVLGDTVVATTGSPWPAGAYFFKKQGGAWGFTGSVSTFVSEYVAFSGSRLVTSGASVTETFDLDNGSWVPGYRTNKSGPVALSQDVVLIGQPFTDQTALDAGSIVFGTTGVPILPYGSGCPGTGGAIPVLSYTGCPVGGATLNFSLTKALGGSTALVFIGLTEAAIPLPPTNCTFLVGNLFPTPFAVPLFGPPGDGQIQFAVGIPPTTPDVSITTQAIVLDPANSLGAVTTNGVRITFR